MGGGKSEFHKKVHIDYLYALLSMCIKTVRVTIERTNTEHINFKTEKKNKHKCHESKEGKRGDESKC